MLIPLYNSCIHSEITSIRCMRNILYIGLCTSMYYLITHRETRDQQNIYGSSTCRTCMSTDVNTMTD